MKSGKIIFNLDQSFSEYKNNKNNFQYLSSKPMLTRENEEEDPFEKEFLNSLLANIRERNQEKNVKIQNVNKEENIQFTPRKRKPQKSIEKVDKILNNVNT
jgi:hypothetical protein